MAAIVSPPTSSPATSPPTTAPTINDDPIPSNIPSSPPPNNPNHPPLPPLVTSPPPQARRTNLARPMSHASKNRLSQYSTGSIPPRSRPVSHVFPIYPSSLPYTLVRDFAYPQNHPLHYGPPPEPSRPPSALMTPSIDSQSQRRLSDPPVFWDSKGGWETGSWGSDSFRRATDIPPILLADGPPWSEDEDLQSPVVSSRHRKHKSASGAYGHGHSQSRSSRDEYGESAGNGVGHVGASHGDGHGVSAGDRDSAVLNPENYDRERGYYMGTSGDGSERYYVNQEGDEANGPGGEVVTYPPDQARHSTNPYQLQPPHSQYGGYGPTSDASSQLSSPDYREDDQSRYSRDYQFTITSPDEEMHGKAVALFDFARENENELPLVEGQIIWVSYRHGQGWLVAMDPKTQESGLVPEEYVRLLRDIEGGMNSLTGQVVVAADGGGATSPNDGGTPTQAEHQQGQGPGFSAGHTPTPSNVSNGYHQPIVSTFSTSSKDLDPYPQHLLGTQAGQTPPQVIHYHGQRGGSQANTPTLLNHQDVGMMRRGSQDVTAKKSGEGHVPSTLGSLPDDAVEETAETAAAEAPTSTTAANTEE